MSNNNKEEIEVIFIDANPTSIVVKNELTEHAYLTREHCEFDCDVDMANKGDVIIATASQWVFEAQDLV